MALLNLGGGARDLTRELNPLELLQGGTIPPAQPGGRPVLLDAMSFLMYRLQERLAPLGEERMLSAVSEMMGLHRNQGESVDSISTRFNVVKHRAAAAGGFLVTSEGYSWTLLKACGIHPDQMNILLAPLQGRLPTTDAKLTQLQAYIRPIRHG